jgi:hypothetical protein
LTGSGPGSTSGQRASVPPPGTSRQPAAPAGPFPRKPRCPRSRPGPQPTPPPGRISAAELFGQLFPAGVQMTAELLADLEQWARLTSKLAAQDGTALQDG